jgi:hypothetical protein
LIPATKRYTAQLGAIKHNSFFFNRQALPGRLKMNEPFVLQPVALSPKYERKEETKKVRTFGLFGVRARVAAKTGNQATGSTSATTDAIICAHDQQNSRTRRTKLKYTEGTG